MRWKFHAPDKPRLVLDVETYSASELKFAGPHAYAEHPTTGVHCLAWELKGGHHPGKGLWLPGQPIPRTVWDHITSMLGPVVAHNWLFEHAIFVHILGPLYRWPIPFRNLWSCTMARALYHGLPGGLDLLSEALELDNPKDKSARRNMLYLAKPRTRAPDGTPTSWWHHDPKRGPEMLRKLYDYCVRDVAAESEADDKLPELPERERRVFLLDAKVNLLGVQVDLPLVSALQDITTDELGRIDQVVQLATGGAVKGINHTGALRAWVQAKTGVVLPSLAKAVLPDALEATKGTVAHLVVQARAEGAKSSTGKLQAMQASASRDGRARLLFQYYGAGRTGRWAGRRVQPQNMPRPLLKDAELRDAIAWALKGRRAQEISTFFPGTVMGVVSSCLRGCLVAAPGHALVSVDLSQIEARVVAWLAGQRDILDVFRRGEDVYTHTARKIGSSSRQMGKVLVLACGFGMGGPKFAHTAGTYGIELDEETAQGLVWDWREANPAIVQLWRDLGDAFKRVVQAPAGTWERLGHLQLGKTGRAVRIRLPSGRDLVYQAADVGQDEKGRDELGYLGVHQLTNRWMRLRTYGGKLTENVVQAVARDVLSDAILTLDADDYRVVGTVHDEALIEAPESQAAETLAAALEIFRRTPPWAPNLPVGAEGWTGKRYKKG